MDYLKRIWIYIQHEQVPMELRLFLSEDHETDCEVRIFDTNAPDLLFQNTEQCPTLFITDDHDFYQRLNQSKEAYLIYEHTGNSHRNFEKAKYIMTGFVNMDFRDFENLYRRCKRIPWDIIETDRLMIREICEKDVDALYEIYQQDAIARYVDDLSETLEKEKEYINQYIDSVYPFFGYGMWIVETLKEKKVIGRAGFNFRDENAYDGVCDSLEIGFLISTQYQGQGYATESIKGILEFAADELPEVKLCALVSKKNRKSARVCLKNGFYKQKVVVVDGKTYDKYIFDGQKSSKNAL